mmetsp:Transcript_41956/g.75346  ORF Transcript_41956/g.75346 Transcript_41956/m.75346 type:complete len:207 (-) Transcript_41956:899-1519(-)
MMTWNNVRIKLARHLNQAGLQHLSKLSRKLQFKAAFAGFRLCVIHRQAARLGCLHHVKGNFTFKPVAAVAAVVILVSVSFNLKIAQRDFLDLEIFSLLPGIRITICCKRIAPFCLPVHAMNRNPGYDLEAEQASLVVERLSVPKCSVNFIRDGVDWSGYWCRCHNHWCCSGDRSARVHRCCGSCCDNISRRYTRHAVFELVLCHHR